VGKWKGEKNASWRQLAQATRFWRQPKCNVSRGRCSLPAALWEWAIHQTAPAYRCRFGRGRHRGEKARYWRVAGAGLEGHYRLRGWFLLFGVCCGKSMSCDLALNFFLLALTKFIVFVRRVISSDPAPTKIAWLRDGFAMASRWLRDGFGL
jgi:hypothetical protein